jgi:hypothetical protein
MGRERRGEGKKKAEKKAEKAEKAAIPSGENNFWI